MDYDKLNTIVKSYIRERKNLTDDVYSKNLCENSSELRERITKIDITIQFIERVYTDIFTCMKLGSEQISTSIKLNTSKTIFDVCHIQKKFSDILRQIGIKKFYIENSEQKTLREMKLTESEFDVLYITINI